MSKSFLNGKNYQHSIFHRLIDVMNFVGLVKEVEGSKSGPDIRFILNNLDIGLECKNKGSFEGGSLKLSFDKNRLVFVDETSIHSKILGNDTIYDGLNLPWYDGKRNYEDWTEVKAVFEKDIYKKATDDSISEYYKSIGTYYIQIEGKGLYHTGLDILNAGVPFFSCPINLRIRSSKHKKNGIPTDITGALIYNKRNLQKSCYSLDVDGKLPKYINLIKV